MTTFRRDKPLRILHTSKQYVCVPVRSHADGSRYDPTDDSVFMAFTDVDATPGNDAWVFGSWESIGGGAYLIRCLVGPAGTITLEPREYDVWVKIEDSPEVPQEYIGRLIVT